MSDGEKESDNKSLKIEPLPSLIDVGPMFKANHDAILPTFHEAEEMIEKNPQVQVQKDEDSPKPTFDFSIYTQAKL